MTTYFKQYRPFFIFLIKFFSTYIGFTFLYQLYLNQFDSLIHYQVDDFTYFVAQQVHKTLLFFNYDSSIQLHEGQPSVKLFLNTIYIARVVEGCNAVSVIILFMSFVIAFSGKFKHMMFFIIGGSLIIHFLNIFRIALLCVALFYYPEQEHILHGVVFPLFIYGCVFGLWVIWVNKFSSYARKGI